jgi:protoporphyrinogen IX oxidase
MILWIKALHIISVISWMAALFYLPRLFVYHAEAGADSPMNATFKIMERRLLKAIMTPAMIATWVFGLWLVYEQPALFKSGWFHAKLFLVILMSGFHGALSKWTRVFAQDKNVKSPKFFRIANEVPTVLMIAIVLLVVIQPSFRV